MVEVLLVLCKLEVQDGVHKVNIAELKSLRLRKLQGGDATSLSLVLELNVLVRVPSGNGFL